MIPRIGASCTCSNNDSTIPWANQPAMIAQAASATAAITGSFAPRHALTLCTNEEPSAARNRSNPTSPVRKSRSARML